MYKERFLFNIDAEHLDQQVVQFQVYSCDKYARHKLQGETELRLGDIELRKPIRLWMNLRDMDEVNNHYASQSLYSLLLIKIYFYGTLKTAITCNGKNIP